MKKIIARIALAASLVLPFALATPALAAAPNWNLIGPWTFNDIYLGVPYVHTMVIDTFDPITGLFSGTGFYNALPALTWTVNGTESGNDISVFHLLVTAVDPGVTIDGTGIINSSTLMSGSGYQSNLPEAAPNILWTATGTAIPANTCGTLTLKSGTGTQFKHLTYVDPAGSSADGSFTLGISGAAVVTGPDGYPGAWDTVGNNPAVAGASWANNISAAPSTPAGVGDGQNGNQNVWRLFSHSFTLPVGAFVTSTTLNFSSDNSANAFLDNTLIGSVASYNVLTGLTPTVTAGAHEFEFVTKNDAFDGATNPTAVIYKAVINYCVPNAAPECPAAPAVANKLLKAHSVKANTTTNAISSVAQHMGPQTNFDGVLKCDITKYRNAVDLYLDTVVNAY